ncbi:glycerol-3-phosphate dehydrogenase/oxidase [Neobacillus drentensis]|uniref:glycerol-3-phosphate dehydrogenase/oxidase n=1 Tax=Neobacillus drentensis TaxID=220684 RepID=UPI0028552174|nr:glycerol-3-phosphate dehydrogenase/oxidase [Neobacillus drentensis]MDR7236093.1 glycerol-3-phosphate dehydrogenase [Neobacillus drentensis]
MKFSILEREKIVERLQTETYDVLIIGGGITGAGVALDAQARGMKTALVEMQDFAAGTSSRSTKLVHGGLRYLKQFEISMVSEVGKERAIVYENGPHVTTPEWILLPIHKDGTFGKFSTAIGLRIYDFLAGVKKNERRQMLSVSETLAKEPLIKETGLIGGGYYVEYRTDDARLTIEVVKAAVQGGAVANSYTKVIKLIYENELVVGCIVQDQITYEVYQVKAKKVVNATGPWVDEIRNIDTSKKGKMLQHTKGVHIVIDQFRFPLKQAVYFDTADGRMIFAIPRAGKTYVGTTDTFYDQDKIQPLMSSSDRSYLINQINYMFPKVNLCEKDIESSWAGIRPLIYEEGKVASDISRKDEIWESSSGLVTIAGGKLTGYRKMAETIVNLVAQRLMSEEGIVYRPCQTVNLPISGGNVGGSNNFNNFVMERISKGMAIGLPKADAEQLTRMYGSNVDDVFEIVKRDKADVEKYSMPISLLAMLIYGIEEEMTATPIDFFVRRTGLLLFDIQFVQKWKNHVTSYMADRLNWTEEEKNRYSLSLEESLENAVRPHDDEKKTL